MKRRVQRGGAALIASGVGATTILAIIAVGILIWLFQKQYAAPPPQPQVIVIDGKSSNGGGGVHILPPELPQNVNLKSRGEPPAPQQVGMLIANSEGGGGSNITGGANKPIMLPLFGNPTYRGNSRWEYYAAADKQHLWRIPIIKSGRDCSDYEIGCDEIYDGDTVTVPAYPGVLFTASIYRKADLRYIG